MKVIALNGSPRKNGNTAQIIKLMCDELILGGIDAEVYHIGNMNVRGCMACGYCATSENNLCAIKNDALNEIALEMRRADGFILGSPTYYGGIAGTMKSFLDRLFFANSAYFKYKVAAVAAAVRRSGGVEVVHQLHNYLLLAQTVAAPSRYWTAVHGMSPGEVLQDHEGLQTVRENARGMLWLLRLMENGRGKVEPPSTEDKVITNFIRN